MHCRASRNDHTWSGTRGAFATRCKSASLASILQAVGPVYPASIGYGCAFMTFGWDPWEEAFSLGNCVKAWSEIGVSPFTQKVYWDLLEKKKKKEAIASKANINPENLTIEGMVKIMFNIDPAEVPEQPTVGGRSRKRDRDTLHSCDLWDLPGGATGEECMERVRRKTEARQQKEAAAASKKANTAQRRQAASSAANEQGSRVVSALVHTVQVSYLTRANLEAALQFKGIKWDKKALKPALVKLLQDALALPSDGPIPVLVIPDPPAPALAPAPRGHA
ncbi:hypothetical protein AB1Y20_003986 [Prymnesium parvum]|uniref:Uncharacterized protein n=1 Tax=Prymnesium parvum TaxID=97485 RepID=A0AB34J8N0_PRYPA